VYEWYNTGASNGKARNLIFIVILSSRQFVMGAKTYLKLVPAMSAEVFHREPMQGLAIFLFIVPQARLRVIHREKRAMSNQNCPADVMQTTGGYAAHQQAQKTTC
jgi:hypothetical protein